MHNSKKRQISLLIIHAGGENIHAGKNTGKQFSTWKLV